MHSAEAGRWQELQEAFGEASALSDEAREAFLVDLSERDAALHAEVRALLESGRDATGRLRGLVAAQAESAAVAFTPRAGQRLGAYTLGEVIGSGGMGTVFSAERGDGEYRQRVAIKVLQNELVTPALAARFRDERRILAELEHPGIVRLFDGGTTADGLSYIVMEHVKGVACTSYASELPVRERVELLGRVCDAVQYAHQRLVVHRDIKPSNILVTAEGQPKLLDFGIAKLLAPDAQARREARTRTGVALLTPEYASPEQARGEAVTVGTDVYSLGAVLYELLTGRPPQAPGDTFQETLYRICELLPQRPSSVVTRSQAREIGGDLDSIVLKALQKDVAQRYGSAADLAADLRRLVAGLPVTAREATFPYRARKFVQRNRARLGLAAFVTMALVAATAVSVREARRAERQTRTLLQEQGTRELASGRAARALPYLTELARAGEDSPALRFLLAEAVRPLRRELWSLPAVREGVSGIAWAPDGAHIAITGHGSFVYLHDPAGALVATLDAHTTDLTFGSFDPEGKHFAAVGPDGNVHVWEIASQRETVTLKGAGKVNVASFSPSGRSFYTAGRDAFLRVWSLENDTSFASTTDALELAAFGGTEEWVATGSTDGTICLFHPKTGERLHELHGHRGPIRRLVSSADGDRLFSASADGTARIWDARRGVLLATLTGHGFDVRTVDVSPDDRWLVTGSYDNTAKVWDATSGAFVAALLGHTNNGIEEAHFSSDSNRVVTVGGDNTFRVWNASTGAAQVLIESAPSGGRGPGSLGRTVDARFSPDGTALLTASGTQVKLLRVGTEPLITEVPTTADVHAAAFSPDERLIAAAGAAGLAGVWDAGSRERVAQMEADGVKWWDVAWHPDGARLLMVGEPSAARVYPAHGGAPLVTLIGHRGRVTRGTFRRDGARVLTAASDKMAVVWDTETGKALLSLEHPEAVMSAAWSPDGAIIATACWDHFVRLWDASSGQLLRMFERSPTQLLDVSFSRDGTRLATSGHDGQATLWSVESGRRYLTLHGHSGPVTAAAWSPDDALIATSADDQTARIWDATSGALLGTRLHRSSVMQVVWNRAGDQILTAAIDHSFRVWDVQREHYEADELAALSQRVPWRLVEGRLELTAPDDRQP